MAVPISCGGTAPDVERFERVGGRWGQIWDTVPGGALGRGADAMAEILVEMRRPSVPMSGDLLFDRVGLFPI
jgi:hypothetical protein